MLIWDDDYTHEEFIEWWRGSHAGLTRESPGLAKCTTNVPIDPEWSEYDGIIRLYFEDMAALKAAFNSEVGQCVNADATAFTDMERGLTLYVEETVHPNRS